MSGFDPATAEPGFATAVWREIEAVAPTAGWVLVTLVTGSLLAWVAGRVTRWAVRRVGLESLGEKAGVAKLLYAVGLRSGLATLLGKAVFWAGLLLTFSAVAELLGLPGLASIGATVTAYLPRVFAAGAILVAGAWLGAAAQGLVQRAGERSGRLAAPAMVGRIAQFGIVLVAATLAAQQAGLETSLVQTLIAIVLAGAVLAVSLAFALGSRPLFRNLLSRPYVQPHVPVGARVRAGEVEGHLLKFTSVAAVLKLEDGSVHFVPCEQLVREGFGLSAPESSPSE